MYGDGNQGGPVATGHENIVHANRALLKLFEFLKCTIGGKQVPTLDNTNYHDIIQNYLSVPLNLEVILTNPSSIISVRNGSR